MADNRQSKDNDKNFVERELEGLGEKLKQEYDGWMKAIGFYPDDDNDTDDNND